MSVSHANRTCRIYHFFVTKPSLKMIIVVIKYKLSGHLNHQVIKIAIARIYFHK